MRSGRAADAELLRRDDNISWIPMISISACERVTLFLYL